MIDSKKTPRVTQTKLYESLTVTKTAKREILVERDLPNTKENAVALSEISMSKLYVFLS